MTTATKKQHLLKSIGHISYTELVELVDENIQAKQNDRFEVIETRFERKLSQETNRLEMKILEIQLELKDLINSKFNSNLKWTVSMWLTQTIAIIATLKAIVR